jgi:hypothetical protein
VRQVHVVVHVLVGVVLNVTYLGLKIWGDSNGSDRPTATTTFDHASALADLDGRKAPTAAYRAALASLASACSNSEGHLSDMALTTRKVLRERGTSESLLTILAGIRSSIPSGSPRMDCAEVASAWAKIRLLGR